METEVLETSAPAGEGVSEQASESQATPPNSQESATPQEPAPRQVDTRQSNPSSQPETRKLPPSEHYRNRQRFNNKLVSLESTVRSLQQELASRKEQPSVPATSQEKPLTDDDFYAQGPSKTLSGLEKKLMDALENVRKEIREKDLPQTLEERDQQKVFQAKDQEAYELAGKSGIPREEIAAYIAKDEDLLKMSERNPLRAVKIALSEMKGANPVPSRPPTNPNVPKNKAQMATVAAGNPSGAGTGVVDPNAIIREVREMSEKLAQDNSLRNDPQFQDRMKQLEEQYRKVSATAR